MPAVQQDIYIEQGATFTWGFVLHEPTLDSNGEVVLDSDGNPVPGDPKDLTGCLMRMQIRPTAKSSTVYVEATSETLEDNPDGGQRIALQAGAVAGRVDVVLTDEDTMKVVKDSFYDMELVFPQDSGELRPFVDRVLQGAVTTDLNVTRDDA